jgi:hypothetical protein
MSALRRRYAKRRALSGVSSQPYGAPVYFALAPLGATSVEYSLGPVAPIKPPPPPPRKKNGRRLVPVARTLGGIFGDNEPSILEPTIEDRTGDATLTDKIDHILAIAKDEQRARKLAQIIAIGGAIFAAARLGIIAFPLIHAKIRGE